VESTEARKTPGSWGPKAITWTVPLNGPGVACRDGRNPTDVKKTPMSQQILNDLLRIRQANRERVVTDGKAPSFALIDQERL